MSNYLMVMWRNKWLTLLQYIAECFYSQVDDEGRQHALLEEIIDIRLLVNVKKSRKNSQSLIMETYTKEERQKGGIYALSGRMGPCHGSP